MEAGADIVLLPPDVPTSFNAIKSAVESGRIAESRIDASVRRILRAKATLELQQGQNRFVDINAIPNTVGSAPHRALAQRIEDAAITLVRDNANVLPLRPSPDLRVVQINVVDNRAGWREGPVGRVVGAEMAKRFPRAVTVQIDDQSTPNEFDMARKLASTGDVIDLLKGARVFRALGRTDAYRLLRWLSMSAADFVRQVTVQRLTRRGLQQIGNTVVALAYAEGLTAHAESVSLRLRSITELAPQMRNMHVDGASAYLGGIEFPDERQ